MIMILQGKEKFMPELKIPTKKGELIISIKNGIIDYKTPDPMRSREFLNILKENKYLISNFKKENNYEGKNV